MPIYQRAVVVVVVSVVVLAAGCGEDVTGAGGPSGPAVTLPTGAATSPAGVTPSGATVSPFGSVVVSVDAAGYPLRGVITATVTNRRAGTIYTDDQKSDCTVVMLQGESRQGWTDYSTCGSERATQTVPLGGGEVRRVSIGLGSENFRPQRVSPGTYRVAFTFRDHPAEGPSVTVLSPTFRIG